MVNKYLKLTVIGGGSSYTPELIDGIIKNYTHFPVKEIVFVDIAEGLEKVQIVTELSKRMVAKADLDLDIKWTLDRRDAIRDSDFIVTQFRVGLLDARIRDEKIPLRYGVIGQETTGPGGFAKAIRTIPVILDICRDIEELAPSAWLINFTNPSGVITQTVLNHTRVKCIGLCNVPIIMVKTVADLYGVDMSRIYIRFAGLNHLNWGIKVFLDGDDITSQTIEEIINKNVAMVNNVPAAPWDGDFLKSLGAVPCPYHRYFYLTEVMLAEESEAAATIGTRGEVVKKMEKELFESYKDPYLNTKPALLESRGGALYSEAACSLMLSIYNDKKDIQVVNILNNGAIANLPDDVVIETNCVIDKNGAHPINFGYVPDQINGLLQVVKAFENLTITAGIKGNYNLGLQALSMNPLVPSVQTARKLLNDILNENIEYLPQFKQN